MKQKQMFDKQGKRSNNSEQSNGRAFRQYVAPRVLSSEDLEAMAVACDPDGVGSGKSSDQGCGTPPIKLGT